jgi:hypothetical protein
VSLLVGLVVTFLGVRVIKSARATTHGWLLGASLVVLALVALSVSDLVRIAAFPLQKVEPPPPRHR